MQATGTVDNALGEEGALIRYPSRKGDVYSYNVLLLRRSGELQERAGARPSARDGLYFEALIIFSNGEVKYDPYHLVDPVIVGFEVLVDPRKKG